MPVKKSQDIPKRKPSQKGKKGGTSSQSEKNRTSTNKNKVPDYVEIDEFTLDDIPGHS